MSRQAALLKATNDDDDDHVDDIDSYNMLNYTLSSANDLSPRTASVVRRRTLYCQICR